jgi:cytosine/uracil/thiamine/allantoin permease
LLTANFLNLESISTSGSAGFLLIFSVVNYVSYKKAEKINASKTISLIGTILSAIAFVVLIIQQSNSNLVGVSISLGIICICFIAEWFYKRKNSKNKQ